MNAAAAEIWPRTSNDAILRSLVHRRRRPLDSINTSGLALAETHGVCENDLSADCRTSAATYGQNLTSWSVFLFPAPRIRGRYGRVYRCPSAGDGPCLCSALQTRCDSGKPGPAAADLCCWCQARRGSQAVLRPRTRARQVPLSSRAAFASRKLVSTNASHIASAGLSKSRGGDRSYSPS